MKTSLVLLSVLIFSPLTALAEGEEVTPHLYTDLNGNGISDLEEGQSPGTNPSVNGIDEVELPPTPPEEEPVAQ